MSWSNLNVLVEDVDGKCDRQVFYSTNPNWSLSFTLRTYALRWSIEVAFENLKQHLGFSDAAKFRGKLTPHKNSEVSQKHAIAQLTYFLSLAG